MADQYPDSFELDIDREGLCRYWRRLWRRLTCCACVFVGVNVGMMASLPPQHRSTAESAGEVWRAVGAGTGLGAVGGLLVTGLIDTFVLRARARRAAESVHVFVEGPFLRVQEGATTLSDRKLHFRSIVDYGYFQGPLMRRSGIGGLRLSTTAGGHHSSLVILGVKDAIEARDMLSEIDRLRENS